MPQGNRGALRRLVRAAAAACIGEEAHRLEDRGLISELDDLLSTYADPRREPWTAEVLPRLRALAAEPGGAARLAEQAGVSIRTVQRAIAGDARPRQGARTALARLADASSPGGRACPVCGAPIVSNQPAARYCSARCRERVRYLRRRAPNRDTDTTPSP